MATQPIGHKEYSYSYRKPGKARDDVDFPLGPEQSKKRREAEGAATLSNRDRIRALLADIPLRENNRLSFLDVKTYRDSVVKDWDALVSGDLSAMGADMSRIFRLMHDPATGHALASGDHPDKAKIDSYFNENVDATREFKSILQLGRLVDTAERKLSPSDMATELTPEGMAWWFDSNLDPAALISGGGIVFGTNGSAYKGLDIRV